MVRSFMHRYGKTLTDHQIAAIVAVNVVLVAYVVAAHREEGEGEAGKKRA